RNVTGVQTCALPILTNLNLFRQFYLIFPEVGYILTDFMDVQILQALPGESKNPENSILQSLPEELKRAKKNKPFLEENEQTKITRSLIERLSFTHISLLLPIEDDFKRTFYIVEAIKGVWSSRELKRQINSLLFERSGMSKMPEKLTQKQKIPNSYQKGLVKDIYTFEFLGLPEKDAADESDLETALLDHLREFILELGNGFCLEARQKRILIGDEYFFVDLVFYHRILKCYVLLE